MVKKYPHQGNRPQKVCEENGSEQVFPESINLEQVQGDDRKIYNLLGLARRAAALLFGMDAVLAGIYRQSVKLVILTEDISAGSAVKVRRACAAVDTPLSCYKFGGMNRIGALWNGKSTAILGVTDQGFADGLQILLSERHNKCEKNIY